MSLMKITGYASTFDPYPQHGGPEEGGWIEQVDRATWEAAVAKKPRVPLRLGVDGPIIGEADLSVDDTGLRVEATVNVGYSFQVKDQEWSDAEGDVDTTKLRLDATLAMRKITSLSIGEMGITAMHIEDPGEDR